MMLGSKDPNYDACGLFRALRSSLPLRSALSERPPDVQRPKILPQYSHIVGYTSHFYAHIGAAPKVFHPPMSKLMWV